MSQVELRVRAARLLMTTLPFPPGTAETLQDVWFKRHNFHLNGSRLVTDGLFNKIYRRSHAKPKKLEPIMLEKIRLQCNPSMF